LGDCGVYEHLSRWKVLLAGANGLRSASEASAKQTMSGGGCSGSVYLLAVLTSTGCLLYEYRGIGNHLRVTEMSGVLVDAVS